jgi:hypothetical protein
MALLAQAWRKVDGITGSGTVRGAQCHGLRDDDVVTGMMASPAQVGFRPWLQRTAQRLQGGVDNDEVSEEVDDSISSREIFW